MWHIAELVEILKNISKEYGYDVYADRKKCVGLCGDLMAHYEEEKNIMQMLFQVGLGEVLSGVPYKSEEELNMGLLRIDKFLHKQGIDLNIRGDIIEIAQFAFIDEKIELDDGVIKPVKISSFDKLHFKMQIPKVIEVADSLRIEFQFIGKASSDPIDSILEKCIITEKVKAIHESDNDHSLIEHGKTKIVSIHVPYGKNKKSILFNGAKFEFVFLCSNLKRIHVIYNADSSKKLSFKSIEIYRMSVVEKEKYDSIISGLQ